MISASKLRLALKVSCTRPRHRCCVAVGGHASVSLTRSTGSFSSFLIKHRPFASYSIQRNDDYGNVHEDHIVPLIATEDVAQALLVVGELSTDIQPRIVGELSADIQTRIDAILEFHEEIGNPSVRKYWEESYARMKQSRNRTSASANDLELRNESKVVKPFTTERAQSSHSDIVHILREEELVSCKQNNALFTMDRSVLKTDENDAVDMTGEGSNEMKVEHNSLESFLRTNDTKEGNSFFAPQIDERYTAIKAESNTIETGEEIGDKVDNACDSNKVDNESDSRLPEIWAEEPSLSHPSLPQNAENGRFDPLLQIPSLNVSAAILLLQTLDHEDWKEFDRSDDFIDDKEPSMETVKDESDANLNATVSNEKESNGSTEDTFNFEIEERLDSVVTQVLEGTLQLDTVGYDVILANLALSGGLGDDEIHSFIMQVYSQMDWNEMNSQSAVELILLALTRRLNAPSSAIRIIQNLKYSKSFKWSHGALRAAVSVCAETGNLELALEVIKEVRNSGLQITHRTWISLMELAKHKRDEVAGIYILEYALTENKARRNPALDRFVCCAAQWPSRDRKGRFVENSAFLTDVTSKITNDPIYVPGILVWRSLAEAFAKPRYIGPRTHRIRMLFDRMVQKSPNYWPDPVLLRCGLQACDVLSDSKLAADLIRRVVRHELYQQHSEIFTTYQTNAVDDYNSSSGILRDIVNAMNICVRARDLDSALSVFHSTLAIGDRISPTILAQLFEVCIKCSAKLGRMTDAEQLLEWMLWKSLSPTDEIFGAIIRGNAALGNHTRVEELFSILDAHASASIPGQSSYNSYIFSCVKNNEWENILRVFDKMTKTQIRLTSSACYGAIMAKNQLEGKDRMVSFVQDLLQTNAELSSRTFLYLFQVFTPRLASEVKSIQDVTTALRHTVDNDPCLGGVAMDMMRALKIAESEENRTEAESSKIPDFEQRKTCLWRDVHRILLQYADLVQMPPSY